MEWNRLEIVKRKIFYELPLINYYHDQQQATDS